MTEDEQVKLALEHARAMFTYHAGQRMSSLNFYLVAVAAFLTGFGFVSASSTLSDGQRALSGLVLSAAGIFLTHCLRALDRRNVQLVDSDEKLLISAEKAMAEASKRPEWNTTTASDNALPRDVRYGVVVPKIFNLYIFLSVVSGLYAVWPFAASLLG
jgi:hypothetical protein